MNAPSAYLGTDPYIFISYAHRDREKVYPFIEALQKTYNVWFDDGLHFGNEWADEIADKLLHCAVFLFMVTGASLASKNCKDELNMAREENKPFVNALVEEIGSFPAWFKLRFMRYQDCRLFTYASPDDAVSDLARKCPELAAARASDQAPVPAPPVKPAPAAREPEERDDPAPAAVYDLEPDGSGGYLLRGLKDKTVRNAVLPAGVREIAARAFLDCTELVALTVPETVVRIGKNAFRGCIALETVVWNAIDCKTEGQTDPGPVDGRGFRIVVPSEVPKPSIGTDDLVFFGCDALKTVTIGEKVRSVPAFLFRNCTSIRQLTVEGSNVLFREGAFDGCGINVLRFACTLASYFRIRFDPDSRPVAEELYIGGEPITDLTVPRGIASIGQCQFSGVRLLKRVTLPESVTSIGAGAFRGCSSLTEIVIPGQISSIGQNAFRGCSSLSQIGFAGQNASVGSYAFCGCSSLSKIELSGWIRSLGEYAFSGCASLEAVEIPEGVAAIDRNAFASCKALKRVSLPDSLKKIGFDAFEDCSSLTDLTIPESVTDLGAGAFRNCTGLRSFTVPRGLTYFSGGCLENCSGIQTIYWNFAERRNSFPSYRFKNCTGVTSIVFGEGVTYIPHNLLNYFPNLQSVTIPESVTGINCYAFHPCDTLKTVCYRGTKKQWKAIDIGVGNEKLTKHSGRVEIIYEYKG